MCLCSLGGVSVSCFVASQLPVHSRLDPSRKWWHLFLLPTAAERSSVAALWKVFLFYKSLKSKKKLMIFGCWVKCKSMPFKPYVWLQHSLVWCSNKAKFQEMPKRSSRTLKSEKNQLIEGLGHDGTWWFLATKRFCQRIPSSVTQQNLRKHSIQTIRNKD